MDNEKDIRNTPEIGIVSTLQPLNLDIEDNKLVKYLCSLEKSSKAHWKEKKLEERRERNITYLFGRQLKGKKLKKYDSEYIDNSIYESEAMLKSLALSKMPDIIIEPGDFQDEQKKQTANILTKYNSVKIDQLEMRKTLGIAFKHLPVYFTAIIKYRWDPQKNKIGDFDYECINPNNVLYDHTATSADPDEMLYLTHYVTKTAKEWAIMFPDKKDMIIKYIKDKYIPADAQGNLNEDEILSQKLKISETWFDWFEIDSESDKEEQKVNYASAVAWRLDNNTLLGKSKNPNWDYDGHTVATFRGQPVPPEIMEQIILTGQQPQGFEMRKVFKNYFEYPRKPFIIMSFDQFLLSAIDETSRIEQVIPIQKSVDETERSLDYMVTTSKGKHIFSKESGMKKDDLQKLDLNDPDRDLLVNGDPRMVHAFIQPVMPPSEMFVHARDKRDRLFAKSGVHGATRGEVVTSTATTNQISREADFTKSDDIVNETILHVVTELSKARLHIMKLRYTPEHFEKIVGKYGEKLHFRLTNDLIDDGMEIVVSASTTDKLKAERNAVSMAQLNLIDPLTYFEDLGLPDPEGRAEKLFLYQTNPEMYYKKFILKKDLKEMATQITGQVGADVAGAVPMPPAQPSPQNTGNIPIQPQGGQAQQGNIIQRITGLFKR